MGTMKAWVLEELHGTLTLQDIPIPDPEPHQVVIKTKAAGLCHSDIGSIEGTIPLRKRLPIVLGHEGAGIIAKVGSGVTAWNVGDRVVATGSIEDAPGNTHDGGYAEYYAATADRLVSLPEGVDWGQAAAATDAGMTSYVGVVVNGGLRAGDRVGIIGLGGLGMTGAKIAVAKGASVYGVEPRAEVWETAKQAGVTVLFHDITELSGMDLDLVVDFAGFSSTTAGAISAVKYGGRVVLVGLGFPEVTFKAYDLVSRNIEIKGSMPPGNPQHLKDVVDLIASGDLEISATQIRFDEIPEGLERLRHGHVVGRLYASLPE
ncbi:zinc-binding dehydrogenase [Mycobacterium syngnathidarum]